MKVEFGNVKQIELVKKLNKLDKINKENIDDALCDLDREIDDLKEERENLEKKYILLEKLQNGDNLTDREIDEVLTLEKYLED